MEYLMLYIPKIIYLIYFMSLTCICGYLPVYYETINHFNKLQIGIIQSIPCIFGIISPIIWGSIADKIQNQRLIHNLCMITGFLLMSSLRYIHDYTITCIMVAITCFQLAPNIPLLDQSVMNLLKKYNNGEYGKQRLFGSLGAGIGAYITGTIVKLYGIYYAFNIYAVLSIFCFIILQKLPAEKNDFVQINNNENSSSNDNNDKNNSTNLNKDNVKGYSSGILNDVYNLLKKKDVKYLFIVVFHLGIMSGVIGSFLTLYLFNISNSNPNIIGTAIAIQTTSELPAFFFSQTLINKLGVERVLLISTLGYFIRLIYYGCMVNPWTVMPFELLHGITFGFSWAACIQYLYNASPLETQGIMMGLLSTVYAGLGQGFGTLIGGILYNSYGASTMWLCTAICIIPLTFGFIVIFSATMKERQLFLRYSNIRLLISNLLQSMLCIRRRSVGEYKKGSLGSSSIVTDIDTETETESEISDALSTHKNFPLKYPKVDI